MLKKCYSTLKHNRFFESRVSTVSLGFIQKRFILIFSSLALTSVWSLERFSVFPYREAISLHCSVKDSTCCTLGLWYSPVVCNVRDCFCFFDIFGKSLSLSPQKTHSIRATVSVDDSPLVFENLSRQNVYFSCSTCESMFCDTLLVFQSIKFKSFNGVGAFYQYRGARRLIFAERSHKYSNSDFNPSGKLCKLSGNHYKRAKSPVLCITWNNWPRSPDVGY